MNAKDELLDSAIDAYQRGMELDLNQYYCSSNLPRLYRQRKLNDDDVRADIVAKVVLAACERAEKLGLADEWLKQTLLGAAFDARRPRNWLRNSKANQESAGRLRARSAISN
jgi:hypothetical protein